MWLLFDAVGTLIYPDPPVAAAYRAAAAPLGSRLDEDEIGRRFRSAFQAQHQADGRGNFRPATNEDFERDRWRRIVADVLCDLGPADQAAAFEALWQHFAQPRQWRLYPDVEPALAHLASAGWNLGIASNFDSRLHGVVQGLAPLAVCRRVFVSSEVGFAKPDPRFFRKVEEQLGVPASELALVGDDWDNDVLGAQAAGWQAFWLRREGLAAGHHLRSLADFPQVRP